MGGVTSGPISLTDLLLDQCRLFKGAGRSAQESRSPPQTSRSSPALHPAEKQRSRAESRQVSVETFGVFFGAWGEKQTLERVGEGEGEGCRKLSERWFQSKGSIWVRDTPSDIWLFYISRKIQISARNCIFSLAL